MKVFFEEFELKTKKKVIDNYIAKILCENHVDDDDICSNFNSIECTGDLMGKCRCKSDMSMLGMWACDTSS